MKKLIIVFCFLLPGHPSFSQDGNSGFGMEKYKQFMSPQASSMLRFDRVEAISNDGAPVVKVPLYAVDDPDFDLSGTLQYSSGGFRPVENDNYVGRDWTLMHGGVIYREVKGMPDDFLKCAEVYAQDGFLANVKKPVFNDAQTRSLLLDNPANNLTQNILSEAMGDMTFVLRSDKAMREVNSDVYSFRFGPHAGKFMINFDGTVRVVSYTGHKYEVDLSHYTNVTDSRYNKYNSSITIKTDDGYSYKFGGELGALEYSIHTWNKYYVFADTYRETEIVISAMHLTEVRSANKRTLRYRYMDNVDESFTRQRRNMVSSTYYGQLKTANAHLNCQLNVRAYHDSQSPYTPVMIVTDKILFARNFDPRGTTPDCIVKSFALNKVALIESIETENTRIDFTYEQREVPTIDKSLVLGTSAFPSECGAALRSVEVYDKIDTRWSRSKTHRLTYEYAGERMFLKKVANADDGTWVFKYNYHPAKSFTANLDHWGYLNKPGNSPEPLGLVPATVAADSQDQIPYSKAREPGTALCSANMLTHVYFPTGGYTVYEYEPHTYASAITQERKNSFRKTLTPNAGGTNSYAGGARVRSIKFFKSANEKAKEVTYRYTKAIDSDQSSGILMYTPRYVHHEKVICFVPNGLVDPAPMPMVYENGDGINPRPDGSHVQYSRIFEISQEESPLRNSVYKETVFTDYATNPDGPGANKFYYTYPYSAAPLEEMMVISRDYDYFCWMRADMENLSHERGKVLRETYYAGADGIEKRIEYRYARKGSDRYNVLVSCPALYNTSFCFLFRPVKVPMSSYHLTGKSVTEYRDAVPSTCSETYEVDDDGYVKNEVRTTSKGDLHKTVYTYRKDRSATSDFGGLLDEKSEWLVGGGTEKMLARQRFFYSVYGKVSGYETYSDGDVLVDRVHSVYTDGYGNPVLISRNDREEEIIVWGYNGSRPVAVIKNAEYDDVKRILGHYRILNNPRDYYKKIAPEELEDLRKQLPRAHITTIEYNAERQPVAVTDPAGIKTRYQYHGNKLAKVYRTEGYRESVLESYLYNYDVNHQ